MRRAQRRFHGLIWLALAGAVGATLFMIASQSKPLPVETYVPVAASAPAQP